MANKSLFSPSTNTSVTFNEAGGVAHALSPKQALAQFAATGCLNSTFYTDASEQLQTIIELCSAVEPEFVAKVALYSRDRGHMKDVPALLTALLSVLSPGLMAEVFDRVIDSPKMLRNFVQIMRSGRVARKSLGTLPKRLIQQWFAQRSDEQIFRASVGNAPSLADVIKLAHPKPATPSRAALYAYLINKPHDADLLPECVKTFEAFKKDLKNTIGRDVPDVPMEMLTSLDLERRHWKALARRVSWQSLRMNLNTFMRHEVFNDEDAVSHAANRLRDREEIMKARVFPYQLMAALINAADELPRRLKSALEDALEISIENVPVVAGKVWILPDVSGSMLSPITGHRTGSTSKIRCVDVAALIAAAFVRKNAEARVLPFSTDVVQCEISAADSVMTNARKLSSLPSGGTNCSAPLKYLNRNDLKGDLVIFVSDNESWMDSNGKGRVSGNTETMSQWRIFKRHNPKAKLVCLDIQPYGTTQAPEKDDVMNIGGFSDAVFSIIGEFADGTLNPDHWVGVIEQQSI